MTGTKLAHYEITEHLGSGGMGDVYRATDSKLGRRVAIKLLPAAFAADAERLSRFRREAQVLASLNHPNIAQIYGLEESGDTRCIVMELVEGETLQALIARGPIPVEDALRLARQIAEALEAAHEKGIVHRDLKPGNVMLAKDGNVKVLDFGLAKTEESGSNAALQHSPTMMTGTNPSNPGVILGTAPYMSPEQARGKPVDRRSDIWAFGTVLFEMLAGQRAFPGEDLTETLAAVVKMEPKWEILDGSVPPRMRQVLRMCLQKDPRQRAQAIGDVRLALEGAFETDGAQPAAISVPAPASRRRVAWVAFGVAMLAAGALAIPAVRHLRETPQQELRTDIVTPTTDSPVGFALSPNGQQIVFVASDKSGSRLWLRALSSTTAQPLGGTEGAILPFWSPNGGSIAFFADGSLKRLDLGGGAPQTLAPALSGTGGAWSERGEIVFAPTVTSPLMRVPAGGGAPVAVTTLQANHSGHAHPWFLPDGRSFLFYVRGTVTSSGIYMSSLDGSAESAPTLLTPGASNSGVYLPSGWLLWMRDRALVAQRLELSQKALVGEPVTLADGIVSDGRNRAGVSASATGLLAYRTGESSRRVQLTWFDRSGAAVGTIGEPDPTILNPALSPDGRRVVVSRLMTNLAPGQGNNDLWLLDGARTTRITFDAAAEMFPLFSADGTRVVFRSTRRGVGDLFEKVMNRTDVDKLLVSSDQLKTATGWSKDRYLLYMSQDPKTTTDLWVLPPDGSPVLFLQTPFREAYGSFSPDGRWVAYQSNESGQMEIYVRPFVAPTSGSTGAPSAGAQWQVSTAGGISAVWRHDGEELYYLDPSGALMAAPISVVGNTIDPGTPVKLFATRISGGGQDAQQGRQYDVARDGRFLINTLQNSAEIGPITLVQNWKQPGK